MAHRTCSLFLLVILALLTGCGADVTPFYDENIAIKQAYTAELKKIVDSQSAQAALPQLEKLSDRYAAWEQSIRDVVMTVDDYDRHKDRYEPAVAALISERDRVHTLLEGSDAELAKTIGDLCQGPINH